MRRLVPAVLLLALLAAPGAAHGGYFPAEVIDGPSADILSAGDVDVARDGNGGVVYLKNDAGAAHVFLSRLQDGAFQPPERMDTGVQAASSQPVFTAGFEGRQALAYVNENKLWVQVRAKNTTGYAAPVVLAEGDVSEPSIDISVNGVTYVSWTQGGDIRAARAERDSADFTTLAAPVDIDPARVTSRSRVAVSADGSALVVWEEPGGDGRRHVFARRLFELRLSQAPQDLNLAEVDGRPATDAGDADVDIEDDSSYAQVVFTQQTAAGPRLVMRRLVGSQFEPALLVDGGGTGKRADIDMTGRGEALIASTTAANEAFGGILWEQQLGAFNRLDSGTVLDPLATAAIGENEDGGFVWLQGTTVADAVVQMRFYDNSTEGLRSPQVLPDTTISNPQFGGVDPALGMDASASRAGDIAAVFVQVAPDGGRRLVAGFYDKPPTRSIGYNSTKTRRLTTLRWSPTINVFGPVAYRVLVDGEEVGSSLTNELEVDSAMVPDGRHTWQIVTVDRRLQEAPSQTRRLRVDNTPPVVRLSTRRRGRSVTFTVRARDTRGRLPTGLSRIVLDPGTGKFVRIGRRYTYTYSRGGRKRARVRVFDKAGNATTITRRV
jgi:hypothetical protein